MKNIIFINSHPIQYFAPMYKYMNENGVKTSAWYCSSESIKGGIDKQFGVKVKWDIPLLEGYEFRFFKNHSWKPSHFNGFFGLLNLGMIAQLFKTPKSTIIVHGWHYCTLLLILILGKIKGHTICVRCDIPQNQEELKKGCKQTIKQLGLKYIVFPRIDYFLYIGSQNKLFYKSYNLDDNRLISCPYAVDNNRFKKEKHNLKNTDIAQIKTKKGIPIDDKVIAFSGKYISKKRPLDLIQAFAKLNLSNCWLLMIGEGELRVEMENFIREHKVNKVILTGFINQSQISEFYALSDVFVMCSSEGENWGLSVNEAMNFNLPLILSDLTGCSDDLVIKGNNGLIFKTADIDDLSIKLKEVLIENKLSWTTSSEEIVDNYSFASVTNKLKTII